MSRPTAREEHTAAWPTTPVEVLVGAHAVDSPGPPGSPCREDLYDTRAADGPLPPRRSRAAVEAYARTRATLSPHGVPVGEKRTSP